jgi:hypothetical protein
MNLVKLDVSGLIRTLLGATPQKGECDTVFIKIVVQVIRAVK